MEPVHIIRASVESRLTRVEPIPVFTGSGICQVITKYGPHRHTEFHSPIPHACGFREKAYSSRRKVGFYTLLFSTSRSLKEVYNHLSLLLSITGAV